MMAPERVEQVVTGNNAVFSGTGDVTQYNITFSAPPMAPVERRELLLLLEKVETFWIEGVLKQSLHEEVLLALDKEMKPDAVEHPWARVLELPDHSSRPLRVSEPTARVFERTGRLLLILGEPGSGKTTTLLEIARDLLKQARADPQAPIPVVLNLSTWPNRRQRLVEWLVEELRVRYQIPAKVGRKWVEEGRLLFCLDGLDEVRRTEQSACLAAINEFGRTALLPGLVVCSRLQEYVTLPERLKLTAAVVLQPLTREQINQYLEQAGSRLETLRSLLEDPEWYALAESPLMLSVMSLAYRDLPPHALEDGQFENIEARRRHTFETYTRRMFERKLPAGVRYPEQKVRAWLSWLAHAMRERSLSVFAIEQLQPGWLSAESSVRWYYRTSRYVAAVVNVLPLIGMLCLAFLAGGRQAPPFPSSLSELYFHPGLFLPYVFLVGWAAGVLDLSRSEPPNGKLEVGRYAKHLGLSALLLLFWLQAGWVLFLLGRSRNRTNDIGTVESVSWSREHAGATARSWAGKSAIGGLMFGGVAGVFWLVNDLVKGKSLDWFGIFSVLIVALYCASVGAIFGALGGFCLGGVNKRVMETKTRPNQGILLSLRTAIRTALLFLVLGFVLSIPEHMVVAAGGRAEDALFGGWDMLFWMLGAWFASWLGGLDVLKHYVLRRALAREDCLPGRIEPFLDYATRLVFLRRIGGSYAFVHRLLLEHFARQMPAGAAPNSSTTPSRGEASTARSPGEPSGQLG